MIAPLLVVAGLLGAAEPIRAQAWPPDLPTDTVKPRVSAAALVLPGIAGSALGTVTGFHAGRQLGWGGGDDPGLTGAVAGAALASTLATTVFILMSADGRIAPEGAWGPSAVGAMGGVLAAVLASSLIDGSSQALVFVVSYSAVQGTIAALLAATNQ